jgi:hypothetical protein
MKGTFFFEIGFPLLKNAKAEGEKKGKDQRKYSSNDPA